MDGDAVEEDEGGTVMSIGYHIVQQEVVERAMERFRLERQIREVKAETARKRALLAGGGRMVEMRPRRGPHFRRISPEESQRKFEEAMRKIEKTHPLTAARFRAQRASR